MVCKTGVIRQSWNLRYVEKHRVTEIMSNNSQTQHQGVVSQTSLASNAHTYIYIFIYSFSFYREHIPLTFSKNHILH